GNCLGRNECSAAWTPIASPTASSDMLSRRLVVGDSGRLEFDEDIFAAPVRTDFLTEDVQYIRKAVNPARPCPVACPAIIKNTGGKTARGTLGLYWLGGRSVACALGRSGPSARIAGRKSRSTGGTPVLRIGGGGRLIAQLRHHPRHDRRRNQQKPHDQQGRPEILDVGEHAENHHAAGGGDAADVVA